MVSVLLDVRRKMLAMRAIHRLIETRNFDDAWDVCSEFDRITLQEAIDNFDVELVRDWIKRINRNSLSDLGVRQLRSMASNNHVKNYSRMQKTELIAALIEKGIEQ